MRVSDRLRRRSAAHALVIFVLWPVLTIVAATLEARFVPYISVPWFQALTVSSAGVFLLAPDFALIGAGLLGVSLLAFSCFGWQPADRIWPLRRLCLEPIAMLTAILCGACLWYPTVLSHAAFFPFWTLPSAVVLSVFMFIGLSFVHDVAPRGRRLRLAIALGVLGFVTPAASIVAEAASSSAGQPSEIVLLGIDSLSQTDDVAALREWVKSQGGAWYERAVAPGLLTNAVWASVMTGRPVREHGIFHTFQPFPADGALLVESARVAGFHTVSVFSDQLTCSIGTEAGFDEDRSGPVGWRQLGLAIVENSSMFLPLFRPLLPWAPWSVAPPNHAGTFTYDLRRELRDILMSGTPGRRTFVAAHLTYLHMSAYPRMVDLSWNELLRVGGAQAKSLRDRTLDWQDADLSTDPVPLHRWKLARLQEALSTAAESTTFVERGGKLLMFSDHGARIGLTPETFKDRRYHHVVLASIGLPAKAVDQPTSLTDIGALLGLLHPAQAAEPVVEFASPPQATWSKLAATAQLRWSGSVELDPQLLGLVFKELRSHHPWTAPGGADVVPAALRQ